MGNGTWRKQLWPATWRWFFATVFFGVLLPIGAVWFTVAVTNGSFSWSMVGGRGELFLMAVGVNGSTYGVARRTQGPERMRGALEAFTALSLATLSTSAIAWGVISGLAIKDTDYDPDAVTAIGFGALVVAVVVSMMLVMTDANLQAVEASSGQPSVINLPASGGAMPSTSPSTPPGTAGAPSAGTSPPSPAGPGSKPSKGGAGGNG